MNIIRFIIAVVTDKEAWKKTLKKPSVHIVIGGFLLLLIIECFI